MGLELWTHDAITGNEREQVFPGEDSSWSMNISGTGECSFVFVVEDTDDALTLAEIRRLFTANSTLFSLRWGTDVLGAWKLEEWDYDDDKGTVTVPGVELRNELSWRMTYALSGYEDGTLIVKDRSFAGAMRAVILRFMQWAPEWKYPIDPPADGAGGFTKTWWYWEKLTINDIVEQFEAAGNEFLLRPYLTAERQLRFQALVARKVQVGTTYFHLQDADSPLSGLHYMESGTSQLTGGQALGNGSGQDQPVARAIPEMPFLIPIRDAKRGFPDLSGPALQEAAQAWYDDNRLPIAQWSVDTFTASDSNPAGAVAVGSKWVLKTYKHRVFPNGAHLVRVLSASGSFSDQMKVEVQSGS